MVEKDYEDGILKWRDEMDRNLRSENGWLALAGLFWLRNGINLVGSDPGCDIRLPERAPAKLGRFEYDGSHVMFQAEAGQTVQINGVEMQTARLNTDQEDEPSFITLDQIRMLVIRRAKGVGVRLWDNVRAARRTLPPRAWYPVKSEYHVPATYSRFPAPRSVEMPDIFGEVVDENMDGEVAFQFAGQRLRLLATELPDHRLYLQFNDLSNGKTTYPSGRYHYTEPHQDGTVAVDFNKAYCPPCAFTEYATCTFAPKENHLKVAIEAGEIYTGHD